MAGIGMGFGQKNSGVKRLLVLNAALALLLGWSVPMLSACALTGGGGAQSEGAQSADDKQPEESEETTEEEIEGRSEGDAGTANWADECLDRRGDITAYAVAELTGGQLEALLLQQDYVWSERNQMWVRQDGSAALVVNDAKGEHLSSDEIAELSAGAKEAATSYRMVTSGYSNGKKAFQGLAGKLMTCEDVEITDNGVIGIVTGPSKARCLVFVSESHDVYLVSLFSEKAVEAGLFNEQVGCDCGTSIDDAFKYLAGRAVGEEV